MADVRSLLREQRKERRITHPHATYSTTGTLICLVCNTQLKSESLWAGHQRSPQHAMRLQRMRDGPAEPQSGMERKDSPIDEGSKSVGSRKRKASIAKENELGQKRNKSAAGVPEGFFDAGHEADEAEKVDTPTKVAQHDSFEIPTRPATPAISNSPSVNAPASARLTSDNGSTDINTPTPSAPPAAAIDEDEWAAFEADIAVAQAPEPGVAIDATISAPAMTTAELVARSMEETNAQRKERQEAEMEGDREDVERKRDEELEEMEGLEERVRRLREKREKLRLEGGAAVVVPVSAAAQVEAEEDEEDDDDEDDDDWDGFRLKR